MLKNKNAGLTVKASAVVLGVAMALSATTAQAGAREQAKRMFDRIAGVPPSEAQINAMVGAMSADPTYAEAVSAAATAFDSPSFYNVTLKNLATPWTNEAQTVFEDLNDFSATVIGLVRDDADFRTVLYDNVVYVGASGGLTAYSNSNNQHYVDLEASGANLGDSGVLVRRTQTQVSGLPDAGTAGVMTTRAAAKAFFVAGTNRAMFRFTLMNFLCNDLEQVKDTSRPSDRVRQDVSRSPGGDSRIFLNSCVGCHSGMDPLAQAFAYYEWTGEEGTDAGELIYTPGTVQGKYLINADNFRYGYVTPSDRWDNYWRTGQNSALGWSGSLSGSGNGAKSLGMELAHSNAFAQCQAKQVFKTVCLHTPTTANDHDQINTMVSAFQGSNYQMKSLFTNAAAYCRGE